MNARDDNRATDIRVNENKYRINSPSGCIAYVALHSGCKMIQKNRGSMSRVAVRFLFLSLPVNPHNVSSKQVNGNIKLQKRRFCIIVNKNESKLKNLMASDVENSQ